MIADVANGWYRNLPRVSEFEAREKAACIARALRDDGIAVMDIQFRRDPAGPVMDGETGYAPTVIAWTFRDYQVFECDAALMALSPQVTYVEIMRHCRKPARRNVPNCALPTDPVVVRMPSPLAEEVAPPAGYAGPCYRAIGGPPLEFVAADGTRWKKVETGRFFNRSYYWVRADA